MKRNIGTVDGAMRFLIGLVLIAYAIPVFFPHTGWNWVGWIGIVPIATSIFRSCPAYSVFGFSTRES